MKKYLLILTLITGSSSANDVLRVVDEVCVVTAETVLLSLDEKDLALRETYREFLMNAGGICETRVYSKMTMIAKGLRDMPREKVKSEISKQCLKPLYLCTTRSRFAGQAISEMFVPGE